MASATATPDTFPLPAGATQDVTFTFADVPVDESATETFDIGGQQILVTLTIPAPDPTSVSFTVPPTVTRTLVSIDDVQAVVRYTRA